MRDEQEFYAWLDGELEGEAAERVAAEVAADPELQRLAEQHRALNARLRSAFAPIATAPVPERLSPAAKRASGEVVDLAAARARRVQLPVSLWKQMAAMAATLAIGIAVGNMIFSSAPASIDREGGRLVAAGQLEEALETGLASAPAQDDTRIGLTFRDASGAICRSFTDAQTSGLACRESGDWLIRGLFQAPEGQRSDYRMASGSNPLLTAMIEQHMAGQPFDPQQERAAKDKGWR